MNLENFDITTFEGRRQALQAWLEEYGDDPLLLEWALEQIEVRASEILNEDSDRT